MDIIDTNLTSEFNGVSITELPFTDFSRKLVSQFDSETALEVLKLFQKMGLPAPRGGDEFLSGLEGYLVFLNQHGVVIRIEPSDSKKGFYKADRINDNALIVKPLASIKAGNALIEICPGVAQETKKENNEYLRQQLEKQGIKFWDYKLSNIGRIPIHTVKFPDGMPVVVDRLAVKKLTASINFVRRALDLFRDYSQGEAAKAEEELYGPLRHAFKEAWPDPGKMKQFWSLCERYTREGKLVAGWNQPQSEDARHEVCRYGDNRKTGEAAWAAKAYDVRLKSAEQYANSTAPAVPQSPRQPA